MTALPTTSTIAVIGAGTMGAGIAQVAAATGHSVLLFDAAEGAAQSGIDKTRKGLDRLIAKGKMTAEQADALTGRISACGSLDELAPAKLVVEAIVEKLDIKQSVFAQLEDICGDDVILATNTSSISVTAIAAGLKRPERLVGMHFFNPAPVMKLVEVISGLASDAEVAQIVFDTAAHWGKHPVMAKSTPGFIVNRVARPFYAEALRVLQEGGADVATIDAVMRESGGFRMGPFQLMDLIGMDVNYAVTNSVFNAYYQDQRFLPSLVQQELMQAGRLGRKTGHGFYNYAEGAEQPAPNTTEQWPKPERVIVGGHLGVAESLIAQMEAAEIAIVRSEESDHDFIWVDGVELRLTEGAIATELAAEEELNELVLFDLALDYNHATRIAITKADQASDEALQKAAGLFQAIGKQVSVIDDIPGMIVMRTVCMLANEGADAVNQGVCNAEAVDIAMKGGVNYPQGPLAWADQLGVPVVATVLENLALLYGEDRYRISPLIQRKCFAEQSFFETPSS
ncbi:3-hydroxyacyl-CoA dehydrogenase PaaH [Porticoccus sp. W117]|uniref:3-hydroxyacyl-CoA dehydrogenase PaaH n=1 Tax=Porticoccus sp. W117 TaxID=3054777 RepID=UPI002595D9EE|nr:3-hydroxyacyl-CoA dehydrogenase PaaH [Porticoccus sp. W117]MDM3872502.1 3-hydroxyacyl-CoA dehydrogenase PaaH [Porticoccus sp. W117]